jgi:hypothetical protein
MYIITAVFSSFGGLQLRPPTGLYSGIRFKVAILFSPSRVPGSVAVMKELGLCRGVAPLSVPVTYGGATFVSVTMLKLVEATCPANS